MQLKKYGKENFSRKILYEADTLEEMYKKEKELVNENVVKNRNYYNAKEGGYGGWDHINNDPNFDTKKFISGDGSQLIEWGNNNPELRRKFAKMGLAARRAMFDTEEEYRKSMGEIAKKQKGKPKLKLRGWFWITNEKDNKRVPPGTEIPSGWKKGRLNFRKTPTNKITKICPVCQIDYTTYPSQNNRTCSRSCARKLQSIEMIRGKDGRFYKK